MNAEILYVPTKALNINRSLTSIYRWVFQQLRRRGDYDDVEDKDDEDEDSDDIGQAIEASGTGRQITGFKLFCLLFVFPSISHRYKNFN